MWKDRDEKMAIYYVDLELSYAVCEHPYSDDEIDDFDNLLLKISQETNGSIVHFDSYEEFFFKGMTEKDKRLLTNEIKKHER